MPRLNYQRALRSSLSLILCSLVLLCIVNLTAIAGVRASENPEYYGKLEAELIPGTSDLDDVVFKPLRDPSKVKFATPLESGVTVTSGRLVNPLHSNSPITALLIEPEDDSEPYLYADIDRDGIMQDSERFPLKRGEGDNSYIMQTILKLPLKTALFQDYPIAVQYYKGVQSDELKEGDRLVMQSKDAFARGYVDIKGRKTLVQYGFNPQSKKISVSNGPLGVDIDGDGTIVVDRFSPESAEAREETVVFRVGDEYVSTRRVDMEKNQIIMRAHPASDYKRVEIQVGNDLPDFQFTDFDNKKRKLSEFRGKYVLIDFWALWCGPCRRELPYQRTAYAHYKERGLEILGMDNDEEPSQVKEVLKKNDLTWTQATMSSIKEVEKRYRVYLFPTSLLVGPDGKIIEVDQNKMRGRDLFKTLERVLPKTQS